MTEKRIRLKYDKWWHRFSPFHRGELRLIEKYLNWFQENRNSGLQMPEDESSAEDNR